MKRTIVYSVLALLILSSVNNVKQSEKNSNQITAAANDTLISKNGYSEVNGIKMYYEIYGQGKPLVFSRCVKNYSICLLDTPCANTWYILIALK
jgi:hypothetical protein